MFPAKFVELETCFEKTMHFCRMPVSLSAETFSFFHSVALVWVQHVCMCSSPCSLSPHWCEHKRSCMSMQGKTSLFLLQLEAVSVSTNLLTAFNSMITIRPTLHSVCTYTRSPDVLTWHSERMVLPWCWESWDRPTRGFREPLLLL